MQWVYCYILTVKFGFLNLVASVRRENESPLVPFPFTGVLLCDLLELPEPDFGDASNGDDVIGRAEAPPTLKSC